MFFRRKESWSLQVYGKLELAKDYLRIGCSTGGGIQLRDWLDRGFSAQAAEDQVRLAWPARFLWGPGSPLAGTAVPSSDEGGLREFPFVVFIERKRRAVIEEWERGFAATAALWTHLDGHYGARANFTDGQGYIRALRNLSVEPGDLVPQKPESVGLDSWLESLWPGGGAQGFRATLDRLAALAKESYAGPLRLPLAPGLPYLDQACAWLTALVELELAEGDEVPTLFFPQERAAIAGFGASGEAGRTPFLAVLPERVEPAHVAWLAAPGAAPLGAGDFVREGQAAPVAQVPVGESLPPLSDSIRGILAAITG